MRQSYLQNLIPTNTNFENMQRCSKFQQTDIEINSEEEEIKKRIKKLILTKDLFTLQNTPNIQAHYPTLFPIKIVLNLPFSQKRDNHFYEDNTVFYEEFLNKLKLEMRTEAKICSNPVKNTDNTLVYLKENLKGSNQVDILQNKAIPVHISRKEKKKRFNDHVENLPFKLKQEKGFKENLLHKNDFVKDIKLDNFENNKHSKVANNESCYISNESNRSQIKNYKEGSDMLKINHELDNVSKRVALTDNKFIKQILKLDNKGLNLPSIHKEDLNKNFNLFHAKKKLNNQFLLKDLKLKSKEIDIENDMKKKQREVKINDSINSKCMISDDSLDSKNETSQKKAFCGCFNLFY